jgi:hypothetical protein
MSRRSEGGRRAAGAPSDGSTKARKRPYRTPRLVTYGTLRELALQKAGNKNDGHGEPKSRA